MTDIELFVRDGDAVHVTLPAFLVGILGVIVKHDVGTHPLAAAHPGPVAAVPGADTDPLAALEQEMASDALIAAHADRVTEQLGAIKSLVEATAGPDGLVRTVFTVEQADLFVEWTNSMYVRMRTYEVGDLAVGAEQSALGMFGFDDELPEVDEVPFGVLSATLAQLATEMVNVLD